jgi:hypothetical protein
MRASIAIDAAIRSVCANAIGQEFEEFGAGFLSLLRPWVPLKRSDVRRDHEMEDWQFQILKRYLQAIFKEVRKMGTANQAGLQALTQADADILSALNDNTTATAAATAEIAALSQQLSGLNSEDPAVASIAADLETKVAALKVNTAALVAATAPAPPAAS